MTANSRRTHTPFNSTVYATLNKCSFIPNTAFECIEHFEQLNNGMYIRLYSSDNKQYKRIVLFNNKLDLQGIAGILVCNKTKEIIYCETAVEWQNKGIYRQLRAYFVHVLKFKVWSVWYTPAMQNKLAC